MRLIGSRVALDALAELAGDQWSPACGGGTCGAADRLTRCLGCTRRTLGTCCPKVFRGFKGGFFQKAPFSRACGAVCLPPDLFYSENFKKALTSGKGFVIISKSAGVSCANSGCSAVGSAPGLGPGCRRFESCHSDHGGVAQLVRAHGSHP